MFGNMKLFLVLNRISHLFALLTREISWSTLEIISYFAYFHIFHVLFPIYYMAQVTSGKTTRCDWLLTWKDFSVMTAGIMKIVNAL